LPDLLAEALLGVRTPFGTTQIHARVTNFLFALRTNPDGLIFPELDLRLAMMAGDREDVSRPPKLLILSRAMNVTHGI